MTEEQKVDEKPQIEVVEGIVEEKEEKPIEGLDDDKSIEKEKLDSKLALTGLRVQASDDKSLKESEKKEDTENKQKFEYPFLFVGKDKKVIVDVDVLFDPDDGRVVLVVSVPNTFSNVEFKRLRKITLHCEFTHPTYNDMVAYRENSMSYDNEIKQFLSDPVKLRLQFIRYHLKEWDLKDIEGKVVELKIDQDTKGLTNHSMSMIGDISPSIIDVILSEFERQTLLV